MNTRRAALLALPAVLYWLSATSLAEGRLSLQVEMLLLQNSGWRQDIARHAADQAAAILGQCDIDVEFRLKAVQVDPALLDFDVRRALRLLSQLQPRRPAVLLVRDSLRAIPFDGEAFGEANTRTRPWLRDTLWIVHDARDPGIVLAHELFHILVNSGTHSDLPGNLMRDQTSADAVLLTATQCLALRNALSLAAQQNVVTQ